MDEKVKCETNRGTKGVISYSLKIDFEEINTSNLSTQNVEYI